MRPASGCKINEMEKIVPVHLTQSRVRFKIGRKPAHQQLVRRKGIFLNGAYIV